MAKKKPTTEPIVETVAEPTPAPTPQVANLLSPDQMEMMNDVAQATTLVQQARGELEVLTKKKLTLADDIEAEVKQRIAQILELSNKSILQIKANGREVAMIKNSIKDMFDKILAFADEVLNSSVEFEKYRKSILSDLDKLILQTKEEQLRVDDQNQTIKEQWSDIARVRKEQEAREKLIYSRSAALEAGIREFGFKEADVKRRINPKKGKK